MMFDTREGKASFEFVGCHRGAHVRAYFQIFLCASPWLILVHIFFYSYLLFNFNGSINVHII